MSYNKHKWVNNVDAVDEDKMNHIENGIKDLDDNKVNKSGDTLTGGLLFENKDGYDAIRKTRTLNGTDYQLTVGVGGNGSARMEYVSNNNALGSIEVRSNGIWNGKTNRRLPECVQTGWGTSLTFKMTGHALVFVSQDDIMLLWLAGNPSGLNVKHIFGSGATATYNGSDVTVTYSGKNFTGTALIF